MTSQLIEPAQIQPITLVETKAHLRVTSDEEDAFIESLIVAATQMLERETGVALITQSWRFWIDAAPSDKIIRLPVHPVQQITEVRWFDAEGASVVLDPDNYFLNAITRPARLRLDTSPSLANPCNGIEVDLVAGFGDVGSDAPDILRRALLVLVAHWYEFRGVYSAEDQPVSVPEAYTRLIRHYRRVRL